MEQTFAQPCTWYRDPCIHAGCMPTAYYRTMYEGSGMLPATIWPLDIFCELWCRTNEWYVALLYNDSYLSLVHGIIAGYGKNNVSCRIYYLSYITEYFEYRLDMEPVFNDAQVKIFYHLSTNMLDSAWETQCELQSIKLLFCLFNPQIE